MRPDASASLIFDREEPNLYNFPPIDSKGQTTTVTAVPHINLPFSSALRVGSNSVEQALQSFKPPQAPAGLFLDSPASVTRPASSYLFNAQSSRHAQSGATQFCVENEIRAAQKLHDLSIQHLQTAKRIAGSNSMAPASVQKMTTQSSLPIPLIPNGPPPTTPKRTTDHRNAGPAVTPESSDSTSKNTPLTKKRDRKAKRRKWLPPLGPASPKPKISSNITGSVSGDYNWICTNPEAFATLSSKRDDT